MSFSVPEFGPVTRLRRERPSRSTGRVRNLGNSGSSPAFPLLRLGAKTNANDTASEKKTQGVVNIMTPQLARKQVNTAGSRDQIICSSVSSHGNGNRRKQNAPARAPSRH